MKRSSPVAITLLAATLLLAPSQNAGGLPSSAVPADYSVSLDLKFTKKRPNAAQRIFSFLDYGPNGFATGFVVGDGLVMTAYHAVSGDLSESKKVQLGFSPRDDLQVSIKVKGCSASVVGVDQDADLALLRICPSRRRNQPPAFQSTLSKDETLVVVARPHGNKVVRKGVFYRSHLFRGQEYSLARIDGRDGYSGSPVYNQKAEIVGVFSGYDQAQKLAVLSPGDRARKLLEDYLAQPKE
jgi:S1-C subfamily serine protease